MRKIETLVKWQAHWNAKSTVIKKAKLKKMQNWWCMNRDNANVKFVSWCNKVGQKPILNQLSEQSRRKESVSDIQVHQITTNWKAILNTKCTKEVENWIQRKMQDILESNVFIIFESSNQWEFTIERKYTVIKNYQEKD